MCFTLGGIYIQTESVSLIHVVSASLSHARYLASRTVDGVRVGACASTPCLNGGDCGVIVGEPGYACACRHGFSGYNCLQENGNDLFAEVISNTY